jgi:hypothetical protein
MDPDTIAGTVIDPLHGVIGKEDTMIRTLPIISLASLIALGTPWASSAQPVPTPVQWGTAFPRGDYQRVYDDGYRSGVREGERDARDGRRPDYRSQGAYRRGSNGNGWGLGNSGSSNDIFRRGFAEGYQDGYRRFRGSYGGNGYPAYPDGGYRQQDGPGYPGGYGYPGGSYGGYPGGAYASPAGQRGFEEGYKEGRDDARDNDRYEPTRKKKYRQADDGYNSRYGSKDRYRDAYRQAFQQGYDRGYREARYR